MQLKWFKPTCLIAILLLFHIIAFASEGNPMVSLIKLSVVKNSQSHRGEIRWYTTPDQNDILRFEVQKSADGKNFFYVTSIASNYRNGLAQYFAEDRNLMEGTYYYRLKIFYQDGSNSSTEPTLMAGGTGGVALSPTVIEKQLYVWVPQNIKISEITVSDALGRKLIKQEAVSISAGLASIDVKGIASGFYHLYVKLSTNENIHLRFSKK